MSEKTMEKKNLADALGNLLNKNRLLILGIIVTAVVGIAGYGIYYWIRSSAEYSATLQFEKAEEKFAEWQAELDSSKKEALSNDLLALIDPISSGDFFVSDRAILLKGDYFFAIGNYVEAENLYASIGAKNQQAALLLKSLISASVAAEKNNDIDKAIFYLNRIASEKNPYFTFQDYVYFNIGRLNVAKKDYPAAIKAFETVKQISKADYWKSLADTAILNLEIQGLSE
jgi:predicted negative regulator of RcsB-dependent stress response